MKSGDIQTQNFWDSINRPRYIVAPMVDLGDLAFRILCRNYNAELTYTPMLNSGQFLASSKYREQHFHTDKSDKPLFAQFCGNNPDILLQASLLIEDEVDAIDINLGCPQGIAKKGHYGAFLLEQPQLITNIVSTLKANLKVPVTCKIRKVSKDLQQTINLCLELQANGCDAVCLHGRTKEQKSQLTDKCDWEAIKIVKERLSIPVIANGGVETFQDVKDCLEFTRSDGIMSAEGILDYPALFSGSQNYKRLSIAKEYLDLAKLYKPKSTSCIKAHLFRMLHSHLTQEIHLRDRLAKAFLIEEFSSILTELESLSFHHKNGQTWYRRYRTNI